jgi:hypothetical protein
MAPRRVYREHRRVLDTQPDDNKPLTYAGYSGYRRVRRVIREGMREDIPGRGDREMVLWRCSRHGVRQGQGGLRVLQM